MHVCMGYAHVCVHMCVGYVHTCIWGMYMLVCEYVHMCVGGYVHMSVGALGSQRHQISGARITGSCEPPGTDAGTELGPLWVHMLVTPETSL